MTLDAGVDVVADAAVEGVAAAAVAAAETVAETVASAEASMLLPIVAAVILLLLVVAFFLSRGGARKPPAVLLLGPCGAGKTLLFHRLVDGADGAATETVSSMLASEGSAACGGGARAVVDFPGHHRLRGPLAGELKRAAGIVFVLDASMATMQAKPAAEILFQVLSSGMRTKILFLCNKSDKVGAKSPARVKLIMSGEIDTLRKTSSAIGAIGEDGEDRVVLGETNKAFNFDAHSPCPTTFLPFSGKTEALDPVVEFLASC